VIGAAVAVVVVALVIAVVAGSGGGDDDATAPAPTADSPDGDAATAPDDAVSIAGSALPDLPDAGPDPAVGQPMPTQSGTGLDGAPVSLPAPGRPTLVMYVAHWCPHCQAEVPVVQDWVDDGGLPAGVDLVTVSTAADDRRPNYPPADWLAGEGWTAPVLADDAAGSAARTAGLTAFPFFVAVDADGIVVTRVSGELTADQLDAVVAEVSRGAG
jgi:thiol-disulfide isomerase/thioredoxin